MNLKQKKSENSHDQVKVPFALKSTFILLQNEVLVKRGAKNGR